MSPIVVGNTLWMVKRLFAAVALTGIGLIVGAGCVIVPQSLPWAILSIAGALLLWLMPELRVIPERPAKYMLNVYIVSILSIPAYYGIIISGFPWISIRRIVFFLFASAVIVTLSGSRSKRSELISKLKSSPLISTLVILFFILNIVATFFGVKLGVSAIDTMNTLLFGMLPFIATVLLVNTERQVRLIFYIYMTCIAFDFLLGMVEFRLGHPFLVYALPPSMRDSLSEQALSFKGFLGSSGLRNGLARVISIFISALSYGEMAAMISPFAGFFVVFGKGLLTRLMGVVMLSVCFGSVFISGSRGAYVGFIAAALVFAALLVFRTLKAKPSSLLGPITLFICAILFVLTLSSVFFVGRVHKTVLGGGEQQASTEGRNEQWALATPKILARPLLGYGPGVSAEVVGWTDGAGNPSLDSYVISLLIGVGLPGCFVFFAMIIAAVIKSMVRFVFGNSPIDIYAGCLGCSLVAYTLYRSALALIENNSLMFINLGLIVCCAAIATNNREKAVINKVG